MDNYKELMDAARRADASGDAEGAARLVQMAVSSQEKPQQTQDNTNIDFAKSVVSGGQEARNLITPRVDSSVGEITPEQVQRIKQSEFQDKPAGERFMIGAGQGFANLGRGAGQILREGIEKVSPQQKTLSDLIVPQQTNNLADKLNLPTRQDISRNRLQEQYINQDKAATAGNVAANISAFLPTAFVPGLNTVTGAGLTGTTFGALQPVTEEESRVKNALISGGTGAAVTKGVQVLGNALKQNQTIQNALKSKNTTFDKSLQEAVDAGYVVPPSYAKSGGFARLAEAISGKAKTNQLAMVKNQEVTNTLGRKYLGLSDETAFGEGAINEAKKVPNAVYQRVEKLPSITKTVETPSYDVMGIQTGVKSTKETVIPNGAKLLEDLKNTRFEANGLYKKYFHSLDSAGDPKIYAAAKKADLKATKLESMIDDLAKANKQPSLVKELQTARTQLAKVYSVEKAMNPATGNLDAKAFASMLKKGKLLTKEAQAIGKFASAFPDVARVPPSGAGNAFTNVDYLTSLITGLTTGNLGYAAAPIVRPIARYGILSNPVQKAMANRTYQQGAIPGLLNSSLNSKYAIPTLQGSIIPNLLQDNEQGQQ